MYSKTQIILKCNNNKPHASYPNGSQFMTVHVHLKNVKRIYILYTVFKLYTTKSQISIIPRFLALKIEMLLYLIFYNPEYIP